MGLQSVFGIFLIGGVFGVHVCAALPAAKDCTQVALIGSFHRLKSHTGQPFGLEIERGAQIAMDELQKGNTRLCKTLIQIDIKDSLANIGDLLEEGVQKHQVQVFIGLGLSDQAIVASRRLIGLSAILVTPTASSDQLNQKDGQTIMMFPPNQQIATSLATAAFKAGARTVAIVYSDNSEYSRDLSQSFGTTFKKLGGQIRFKMSARFGQIPKEDLMQLKSSPVDRVFLPLYELDAAKVISFLDQNGVKAKYIGSDAWGTYSEVLRKYTGGVSIDAIYPVLYSSSFRNPTNESFVSEYRQQVGKNPTDLAAFSYDGVKLTSRLLEVCDSQKLFKSTHLCLSAAMPFRSTTGVVQGSAKASLVRPIQIRGY